MTPDQLLAQKRRLLNYYEDELRALRKLGREFADRYPDQAGKLRLRDGKGADPHVERLLEGVAFLAGRVRAKLDDEFPELTDALLGVLYPHLVAPVPSMAILQFAPSPGASDLVTGMPVPAGTEAATPPVDGVPVRYRTGYPITLWPLEVAAASAAPPPFAPGVRQLAPDAAKAVISLKFRCTSPVPLSQTALGADGGGATVRLFLAGDEGVPGALYQHLFNDVTRVVLRNPDAPGGPAARAEWHAGPRRHPWVGAVGFEPGEALLPYPKQAFPGYKILAEFFAYREKFLFFDLGGWAEARAEGVLEGGAVEALFFLDRELAPATQRAVGPRTFLPGCAPAVNLFRQLAEVVPLSRRRYDYPVVPDRQFPDGYEVYSVEEVDHRDPVDGRSVKYDPFFSYRHAHADEPKAFWSARRRASARSLTVGDETVPDPGTEVDLCFTDLAFDPMAPAEDQVLVTTLCLNRDLPNRFTGSRVGEVLFASPGFAGTVRAVRPPTPTLRPPVRTGAYWRLVSHLALNHLSITGGADGRDVLQEYFRVYDFSDGRGGHDLGAANRQFVEGLLSVESRPAVSFLSTATGLGYARGVEVDVELDEDKFTSVGTVLFSAVLERFLAMVATVNSFTQLRLRTRQAGREAVKLWPPRTGTRPLV